VVHGAAVREKRIPTDSARKSDAPTRSPKL
jgi:hypothetical protein